MLSRKVCCTFGDTNHFFWLSCLMCCEQAAASSQLLCAQFELDGRGSLEVFPDSAVISVFEYKSSQSGAALASCPIQLVSQGLKLLS